MTPLWARMLVIKAYENGEIYEECAQYFDHLINKHKFNKREINFIEDFTVYGDDTIGNISKNSAYIYNEEQDFDSVLFNIGLDTDKNGKSFFNPIKYIKATTYKYNKYNVPNAVQLSQITKRERGNLMPSISFNAINFSLKDCNLVIEYLENLMEYVDTLTNCDSPRSKIQATIDTIKSHKNILENNKSWDDFIAKNFEPVKTN